MATIERADVVVIGLGVIGLSTAAALARRGNAVVGIDRWGSGHPVTSSTGASRSIRVAYDDVRYVRLARQAFEGWRRLETSQDARLLVDTGQVDLGPTAKLDALAAAMRAADVPFDELDAAGVRTRFPELAMRAGEGGLFHAEGGTVLADAAMEALSAAAAGAGAVLAMPERCLAIEVSPDAAEVVTGRRRLRAARVVIAAGPWSGELLRTVGIDLPLAPAVAQVTFLQAPRLVDRPGIADWLMEGGVGVYGHPVPGIGYKVAFDAGSSEPWLPDTTEWPPDLVEQERLLAWLGERMPLVEPRVALTQRHPWTMTPDGDFAIDRRGPIVVAGGCSGHAFKFGPALGELVADVADDVARDDLSLFSLDRPAMRTGHASPSTPIPR
ncbi:MAG: sarcosine oxidase [Actinomycetota bacterium]|nr:sarcosine oxidase [Actinomycetota bacterium]